MKTEDIKRLLEHYYNGEATLEEEKQLKEYFGQTDIPASLQADKKMFQFFTRPQTEPLPEGLEQRLSASIDRWQIQEQLLAGKHKRRTLVPLLQRTLGIAASVLLIAGVSLYIVRQDPQPQDTFDDPALAYAEAQRAFQLFASALDKGKAHLEKAESTTREIQNKLEKCRIRTDNP